MGAAETFQRAIHDFVSATQQFCNGNASSTKALWSHCADATIMGGWGAYEQTWAQVGPRIDWAAVRFLEGQVLFEMLTSGQEGSLAYSVGIEKYDVRLLGEDTFRPFALRVTQIYRFEGDAWRIIHRHADPITDRLETGAILPH